LLGGRKGIAPDARPSKKGKCFTPESPKKEGDEGLLGNGKRQTPKHPSQQCSKKCFKIALKHLVNGYMLQHPKKGNV
jgi:hypothetical protein